MRVPFLVCLASIFATFAMAENQTSQTPITMEQLMRELQIQGGNWTFKFDQPVYAKVVCTVSSFPDGKTTEVQTFVSDSPEKNIQLFFMASAMRVGDYPKPNVKYDKEMKVRLSNCKDTNGTRVIHYVDKFSLYRPSGQQGEYAPSLALNPELNREYVLHYYFADGDPYQAKATICFLADLKEADQVRKFELGGTRDFKAANDQ